MTAATQKSTTSAQMRRIRLERVHAKDEAAPTAGEGYEFVAPLDDSAHISPEDWKRERALCFVHKIEQGDVVQRGLLVHRQGGAGGGTWQFDYALGEGDEESGFRFDAHRFVVGEYVSVRDADGDVRTFKIASVKPV